MIQIISTGSFLPERILTNKDLERMVETSDEWITSRTGIKERHIAKDNEATSDLAYKASRVALEKAGVLVDDIDLIIVATITPDMIFPSTACVLQEKLGAKNCTAFDINAACTGFIYGLVIAQQFLQTDFAKTVLLVASDTLSKITDWQDRSTCVLFGDGAGAVILQKSSSAQGILSSSLYADGKYGNLLNLPAGGSLLPASHKTVDERLHFVKMKGNETFKVAVPSMANAALDALKKAGLSIEDIKFLIPHQANIRIIQAVAKRLDLPLEKVFVNIDRVGNTSGASIAIALDELVSSGRLSSGDIIELVAFGGGFTWGASVIRW